MAADAEDAFAAVIVDDSQNGVPIGPCAVIDQVGEGSGLKRGQVPTDEFPYLVGAASGRVEIGIGIGIVKRLPGPATGDSARRAATCRRNEGPVTCELDPHNSIGAGIPGEGECDAACASRCRSSCWVEVDDVPADMVSRALHHWETNCYAQQKGQR